MSDFELKLNHKFFRITLSSIRYAKNTNTDTKASTTCVYKFTICQTIILNEEFRNKILPMIRKELWTFYKNVFFQTNIFNSV